MGVETRTRKELLATLDEHIHALRSAGERFDEGRHIEARVLAAHIRKLVHHADTSRALIHELGLADRLTWVDTGGVPNPKNASSAACLTLMNVRTGPRRGGEYVPKLALYPPAPIRTRAGGHIDRGARIPFDHWWTNPVVKDADGLEYSRKLLVLALVYDELDSGAELRAAHIALAASASLGWVVRTDVPAAACPASLASNPVMASVRQIGYEVIQTIKQQRDLIEVATA